VCVVRACFRVLTSCRSPLLKAYFLKLSISLNLRNPNFAYVQKDPLIGGRIILRLIFRKCEGFVGLDEVGSGWGQVVVACEYSNEIWGSIKCGELLISFPGRNLLRGVSK